MRLFVDVDDTLILYDVAGEQHPCGLVYGQAYTVNEELIKYIRWFALEHPDALVVIWSGGGREYAEHVARLAGVDNIGAAYLCKCPDTFALVEEDSIVFDDQEIKVPARVWGPRDVCQVPVV